MLYPFVFVYTYITTISKFRHTTRCIIHCIFLIWTNWWSNKMISSLLKSMSILKINFFIFHIEFFTVFLDSICNNVSECIHKKCQVPKLYIFVTNCQLFVHISVKIFESKINKIKEQIVKFYDINISEYSTQIDLIHDTIIWFFNVFLM